MSTNPASTFNRNNNFVPIKGIWDYRPVVIKESTAMQMGTLVSYEVSGSATTGKGIKSAAATTNGQNVIGILWEEVATTDPDYATAFKTKMVAIPCGTDCEAEFTVGAGTFTNVDVGRVVAIHSDSISLAVDTNGLGAVITGFISSTRGRCSLTVPVAVTA